LICIYFDDFLKENVKKALSKELQFALEFSGDSKPV
jgi:hypothetical protein